MPQVSPHDLPFSRRAQVLILLALAAPVKRGVLLGLATAAKFSPGTTAAGMCYRVWRERTALCARLVADAVACIGSLDPVIGGVDR